MDVRVGGGYRLEFRVDSSKTMAFFGRYLEVTPPSRLVGTNDEAAGAGAVTTVTFEEKGGKTLVVMHDLYPSKEALDEGPAPRWDERDDAATGRASGHAGRERGTVVGSQSHARRVFRYRRHYAWAGRRLRRHSKKAQPASA